MISENLEAIKREIGSAELVVVSKYRSIEELQEVYEANQKIMAENRVQELVRKKDLLPKDIEWHMIGHLQRNKVKYIADFISMIQSVDSLKLLKEINKQAAKHERVIPVLLQIHIASEDQKFGFSIEEVDELIAQNAFSELKNVEISGLMGMATNTQDEEQVKKEFSELRAYFDQLHARVFMSESFKNCSMGMSGDCHLAVMCGSTMVRIGSKVFE